MTQAVFFRKSPLRDQKYRVVRHPLIMGALGGVGD
jgi:hypothetical protein